MDFENLGERIQDLRVAINKGDAGNEHLSRMGFKNVVMLSDNSKFLELLVRKRVDLVISHNTIIHELIKSQPDYSGRITKLDIDLGPATGFYFAINRQTDEFIINKLISGFNKIDKNGRFNLHMSPLIEATAEADRIMESQ